MSARCGISSRQCSFPGEPTGASTSLKLDSSTQAVGRLGNRINQELFGPATTLPWAFHINPNYPIDGDVCETAIPLTLPVLILLQEPDFPLHRQ